MRARWVWSYITLVAALLLTMSYTADRALAHADVESSVPANGATVDAGLTRVVITFTEEVSVDQSSAELARDGEQPVEGVAVAVDRANRKVMTLTTPQLFEGNYNVKWRAVTEDDNAITHGTLSFTVTGTIATPLPTPPPEPSSTATTAPSSTPTAIPTATATVVPPTLPLVATPGPTSQTTLPSSPGRADFPWGIVLAVVILIAGLIAVLGTVRLKHRK
jgi:hypothetical protein